MHCFHSESAYTTLTTDFPPVYDIAGFDWLSRLEYFRVFDGETKSHSFSYGGEKFTVVFDARALEVKVLEAGMERANWQLAPLIQQAGTIRKPSLALDARSKNARLVIEDIAIEDPARILHFKAEILFSSSKARSK